VIALDIARRKIGGDFKFQTEWRVSEIKKMPVLPSGN